MARLQRMTKLYILKRTQLSTQGSLLKNDVLLHLEGVNSAVGGKKCPFWIDNLHIIIKEASALS